MNNTFIDSMGILNIRTKEGITERLSPEYFLLVGSEPIKIVSKAKPQTKSLNHTQELKQLQQMNLLKKKLNTLNKQLSAYETATQQQDEDTIFLKGKAIKKSRKTISKYLNNLRADINFKVQTLEDNIYKLIYSGQYVNATSRIELNAKGVF